MLVSLLRLSVFFFSLYGGSRFFEEKLKIPSFFSWLGYICLVIFGLYLAAFGSWLYPAAIFFYSTSLMYGLYSVKRAIMERKLRVVNLKWANILFILYCLLILTALFQTQLEHYDNFSHWALIVKYLFSQGKLPTAQDAIISYASYPMGSSLFVYYAVVIAGFKDSVMLIGQFAMIAAALYAMFAVIRDQSRILVVGLMIAGISLFNYFNISIRMNNLLVDFLLPVIALAGIAIVFKLKKEPFKMSLMVFLTMAVLTLVKSSGLFFSLIVLVYYLYESLRMIPFAKQKVKLIGLNIATSVLTLVPILYWNAYVKVNFPITKHEVSLTSYQSIFDAKDTAVVQDISRQMIDYISNWQNIATQGLILFNLLLLISFLVIRFGIKRRNTLLKILFTGNFIFLFYYVGILMMFLFSMPLEEAVQLAGIERYTSSMIIFILGLALYALVVEIDYSLYEQNIEARNYRSFKSFFTKQLYQYSSVMLIFFAILMTLSEVNGMKFHNTLFDQSIPAQFLQVSRPRMDLNQDQYLVVTTDKENQLNYYTAFVGMYYLYSFNVTAQEDFMMDLNEFQKLLSSYDKVVILEEHWTFDAMIDQLVGQNYGPGIYEVEEILQEAKTLDLATAGNE